MDELTLHGEIYISSKRAAKITGYTKDYVGQLCREGRITAQLVGRNWYVHESSIRKHRFTLEDKSHNTSSSHKISSINTSPKIHDNVVRYTHEDVTPIPLQGKEQDNIHEYNASNHSVISNQKDNLSKMQDTWQELFSTAANIVKKKNKQNSDSLDKNIVIKEIDDGIQQPQEPISQHIAIHKMSSIHSHQHDISEDDIAVRPHDVENLYNDTHDEFDTTVYTKSKNSSLSNVVNILLMITALIFFIVMLLNIYSIQNNISQLDYISGISTYTAK